MNNNTISNPEQEVPKTREMNDCDFLNDAIATEKDLVTNYAIVLNEASNDVLSNEYMKIFKDTHDMQRRLFNLSFKKGWYRLEEADVNKINQIYSEYDQKRNEVK